MSKLTPQILTDFSLPTPPLLPPYIKTNLHSNIIDEKVAKTDYSELLGSKIDPKLFEEILVQEEILVKENYAMIEKQTLEQHQKLEAIEEKLAELYDEAGRNEKAAQFRDYAYQNFEKIIILKPELLLERHSKVRNPKEIEPKAIKRNIRELDKMIQMLPQETWLHFDRGMWKLKLGEDKEALKDFNSEIKNNYPVSCAYAKLERGLLYSKKGNFYKACRDFKYAAENLDIGSDKSQSAIRYQKKALYKYLANVHQKLQSHQDCREDFTKLHEIASTDILAEEYSAIKAEYIAQNKKEEGLQFFRAVLNVENLPENISKIGHENIENLQLRITQLELLEKVASENGMRQEYEDLLSFSPKNYFEEHIQSGHYYGISIGLDPKIRREVSNFWKSDEQYRNDHLTSIIDLIDGDIKNNPKNLLWHNIGTKGEIYLRVGDYEKALETFNSIPVMNSFEQGIAYLSMGDYPKAVSELSREIIERVKRQKDSYKIKYKYTKSTMENRYYFRGIANMYLGNYEEAHEDFSQEIELDTNKKAYKWRGLANKVLGNDKESQDDFKNSQYHPWGIYEAGITSGVMLALAIVTKFVIDDRQEDSNQNFRPDAEEQVKGFARIMFGSVLNSEHLTSEEKESLTFIDVDKVSKFMFRAIEAKNEAYDIDEIISEEKRPELTKERLEEIKEVFKTAFEMISPLQQNIPGNQIAKLAFPRREGPRAPVKNLTTNNFKKFLKIYNEEYIKEFSGLSKDMQEIHNTLNDLVEEVILKFEKESLPSASSIANSKAQKLDSTRKRLKE